MSRLKPGESWAGRRARRTRSRYRLSRKENRLELAGLGASRHETVRLKLKAGKLPLERDR